MLLLSNTLYSKTWLDTLGNTIDIDAFTRSIKFGTNIKVCSIDDVHDSLVGVYLHHQDLFMFTESVREKGYVAFMDTNILQNDSNSSSFGDLGKILGTGDNRSKSGKQYLNMVQLPIIGMITKSLSLDGLACFHPESSFFFYASSIDPTAVDYIQYLALIDTMSLFTTNGIMSMIVDCLAYEGYSLIPNTSTASKYFAKVIDVYPHSFGCNGGVTLAASNQSKSPLVNGLTSSASLLKIMARTGTVIKQSKISVLNLSKDVTCEQYSGPFIKTEFTPQMLQPVPTREFELGVTPAEWASFKDDQSTTGDTAIAWWVNKDFVAYSGSCSW